MKWFRERPAQDERVEKSSNALAARLLPVMLALQAIVLAVKIISGGWMYCLLDALALVVGLGTAAVLLTVRGVWRAGDDALREIRAGCLARAFQAMFFVLVLGEFLCMMLDGEHISWYAPSLIVWGVPALIYTVAAVRGGLLQWGSRKAETTGKAKLAKSTAVGALFFGLVMGGPDCVKNGAFEPSGLLTVLFTGAAWGLMFYGVFTLMLKLGGKQADKAAAAAEDEAEER